MKTTEYKAFYHKKSLLLKYVLPGFDRNLYVCSMNYQWGQSLYYLNELKYKSNFPDSSINDNSSCLESDLG